MSKQIPIRVAIVEDNEGLRRSLASVLRRAEEISLQGSFASAEDFLSSPQATAMQVVLMDINLPGMTGVECVRALKAKGAASQIVMLTVHDHTQAVFESLTAGASGFLLKPVRADDLVRAILEVHRGGAPMTPNIARQVVQTFHCAQNSPAPDPASELSPREREVLELLAKGYLQKEIAEQLGISFHTVQTHTARIYEKLQVRSRAQAVAKFLGA
jgi:DNA-binding NarL/FixJ family response regulator